MAVSKGYGGWYATVDGRQVGPFESRAEAESYESGGPVESAAVDTTTVTGIEPPLVVEEPPVDDPTS